MNNEWKDWCRLCAKPSTSGVLNIFESTGFERIIRYLSIAVNNEDDLPQTVCQACSQHITLFDNFAEHCLRVQEMFCAISEQSDNIVDKLDFIRCKYLQEEPKVVPERSKESLERSKESLLSSNVSEPFLLPNSGIPALKTILKLKTTRKTIPRTKVPIRKVSLKHLGTKIKLEDPERRSSRLQELAQTQIDFGGDCALDVKIESENVESKEELPKKRGRPPKRIVGVVKRKMKSPKVVKLKKAVLIDDDFDDPGMEVKPLIEKVSQPSIFQWKCHVCGEIARNWNSLSIHTRRAHEVPAQVLCLCAKVLTSRASIIKHRLKHTDGYKYKCEKCSKSFHRRGCYELHVLSHVPKEEQPFVCCKCARRFHCESLLRQHEKVHLPKEERLIFPCTTCQKKFSSKSAVSAHIKSIHFGERPFVCDQCGHSFTSKGILQEHLTIHSDETPFKCQHCFKSFKTKYRLKIHLDIHREMPYQCPICPLQLSTRRTLRMHLVVHRETKAFQCSTCGKAFRRAKDLKNHHNLHTGRRPYTCTFCPRTFANGSNCRSHKRRMHPDELRAYEAALLANDPAAAAAAAAGPGSAARPVMLSHVNVPVSRPAESEQDYQRHASFSECNETSMKTLLGLHSARPYPGNEAADSTTHPHAACSHVGQVPNDHDPLRNGHHYSTTMADVSACNAGRSAIDDSRRIHCASDGRSDHVLSMTPLNLNISELHVGRHHMGNGPDQGDRRMDNFHMQRPHMPGLNQGPDTVTNVQHLRQHQSFVIDNNRQGRNEMVIQQNTDQQNILQGYTPMNHTLYQQHSGGIGVPAFPGNPYVQHGMTSSLANYQRSNRNM